MRKFFADFKKFITRGNVIDLAVAVIIGAAFGKIVTSLVNDVLMPLICSMFGKATVAELAFYINGTAIGYGAFLQAIIDFLIIAFFIFLMLKLLMGAKGFAQKKITEFPNREERKELKNRGVNMRNHKEVIEATAALRKERKKEVVINPTTEELLTDILFELKKQNAETKKVSKKISDDTKK